MIMVIHIVLTGVQLLQEHIFNNIYKKALQDAEHNIIKLQVFRMVLCGIPRAGKTTFWKRLAKKDFEPSEVSPSTGAAESHYCNMSAVDRAHMHTEVLFDWQLSNEDEDHNHEALTIYKHIIESHKHPEPQAETQVESHDKSHDETHYDKSYDESQPHEAGMHGTYDETLDSEVDMHETDDETYESQPDSDESQNCEPEMHKSSHKSQPFEAETHKFHEVQPSERGTHKPQASETHNTNSTKTAKSIQTNSNGEVNQNSLSANLVYQNDSTENETPTELPTTNQQPEEDPIITVIDKLFKELDDLLKNGEYSSTVPNIKKMCHLQDVGGQRAFLEFLPTLSVGKALYLIFFNYKNFRTSTPETVQPKDVPGEEMHTGTEYEQIDVIMQSLICVSTASTSKSSNNVALLIGTHVDEVNQQDVNRVDEIIYEKVQPFLKSTLVYAESGDENMLKKDLILKVAIKENCLCNHKPEMYGNVIMNIVEKKLSCPKSEKLPASWYMFCVLLRRLQSAGYSVLQYRHCEHIADKLHIHPSTLHSLLTRLHRVFGIVLYFPTVKGLENVVICDPAFVYKSISELIFKTFYDRTSEVLSQKLRKWGIFKYKELQILCKIDQNCCLEMNRLIILLEHLGIIVPLQSSIPIVKPAHKGDAEHSEAIHSDKQYVIPCVLRDAKLWDLEVQIQDAQACSIVPLRIYFDCGYAPMGGFCYLFAKLISKNEGWKLYLPNDIESNENNIYWRNKVTLEVKFDVHKYMVTLVSTDEYYEIHIIHSVSKEPFQLKSDGHKICKHVWKAIQSVLEDPKNELLQTYTTACICTSNHSGADRHVMKFSHKPLETSTENKVKAQCLRNDDEVIVKDMQPSIMVWFKVSS